MRLSNGEIRNKLPWVFVLTVFVSMCAFIFGAEVTKASTDYDVTSQGASSGDYSGISWPIGSVSVVKYRVSLVGDSLVTPYLAPTGVVTSTYDIGVYNGFLYPGNGVTNVVQKFLTLSYPFASGAFDPEIMSLDERLTVTAFTIIVTEHRSAYLDCNEQIAVWRLAGGGMPYPDCFDQVNGTDWMSAYWTVSSIGNYVNVDPNAEIVRDWGTTNTTVTDFISLTSPVDGTTYDASDDMAGVIEGHYAISATSVYNNVGYYVSCASATTSKIFLGWTQKEPIDAFTKRPGSGNVGVWRFHANFPSAAMCSHQEWLSQCSLSYDESGIAEYAVCTRSSIETATSTFYTGTMCEGWDISCVAKWLFVPPKNFGWFVDWDVIVGLAKTTFPLNYIFTIFTAIVNSQPQNAGELPGGVMTVANSVNGIGFTFSIKEMHDTLVANAATPGKFHDMVEIFKYIIGLIVTFFFFRDMYYRVRNIQYL